MPPFRKRKRPTCPACGSADVLPIEYGLPTPELAEEAKRGEVVLGGCCVTEFDPQWFCKACEHEWRSSCRETT